VKTTHVCQLDSTNSTAYVQRPELLKKQFRYYSDSLLLLVLSFITPKDSIKHSRIHRQISSRYGTPKIIEINKFLNTNRDTFLDIVYINIQASRVNNLKS